MKKLVIILCSSAMVLSFCFADEAADNPQPNIAAENKGSREWLDAAMEKAQRLDTESRDSRMLEIAENDAKPNIPRAMYYYRASINIFGKESADAEKWRDIIRHIMETETIHNEEAIGKYTSHPMYFISKFDMDLAVDFASKFFFETFGYNWENASRFLWENPSHASSRNKNFEIALKFLDKYPPNKDAEYYVKNAVTRASDYIENTYRKGCEDIRKDDAIANKYAELAAETEEDFHMAKMYVINYEGIACEKNPAKAEEWLNKLKARLASVTPHPKLGYFNSHPGHDVSDAYKALLGDCEQAERWRKEYEEYGKNMEKMPTRRNLLIFPK